MMTGACMWQQSLVMTSVCLAAVSSDGWCMFVAAVSRDGTIHLFNFRFDFRYLTHGSIYSRYFSQPRHLSHNIFNEQF